MTTNEFGDTLYGEAYYKHYTFSHDAKLKQKRLVKLRARLDELSVMYSVITRLVDKCACGVEIDATEDELRVLKDALLTVLQLWKEQSDKLNSAGVLMRRALWSTINTAPRHVYTMTPHPLAGVVRNAKSKSS